MKTATQKSSSTDQLILDICKEGVITEKQINLIKNRMNRGEEVNMEPIWNHEGLRITEEQSNKGLNFLLNLWKSPAGKERVNNPFGYREQEVLENFSHFELRGFYDDGKWRSFYDDNRYVKNYLPLYLVVSTEGGTFEYYYNFKGLSIVG